MEQRFGATVWNNGLEQGRQELLKSKKEMAKKLKETGMSIAQIADITELSVEEIEKL